RAQVGQSVGDGFKIVDEPDRFEPERGPQFISIGHPLTVDDDASSILYRTCQAENRSADAAAVTVAEIAVDCFDRGSISGHRQMIDRPESIARQHGKAYGRPPNVA